MPRSGRHAILAPHRSGPLVDPDPTRACLVGLDQASEAALWAPAAREGHAIVCPGTAVIVAAAEEGQAARVGVW